AGSLGKCKPECTPPPSGLTHWWPGDNTAIDIQGNNNGTLKNGANFASGKVDRAFSLDGIDDYVDVGLVDLPGTFTIETWINPASFTGVPAIISNYDTGNGNGFYLILQSGQL